MVNPPKGFFPASAILNTPWKQWLLVLGWALFLLVISLLPSSSLPNINLWEQLITPDKLAHALVYGVFAVLLYLPLRSWRIKPGLVAILLASAYGAAMEGLQLISKTGRSYDLADMLANVVGAILGYSLASLIEKKYRNSI